MKIKGWSLFEIIWLTLFSCMAMTLSILWKDNIFGFSIFLTGVICVVLAAKGDIWNYAFGIYNSIAYAWLSYQNGLYGETMLNVLFFVPTGVIGWLMWRNRMVENTVIMRKMKWRSTIMMIAFCILGTTACGFWLSTLKGQNTPYLDAFNVVASIIATLAMMFRFREQWILYISINVAQTIMWVIRLTHGSENAATMVIMWIAFLVNSIYGFYKWNKGAEAEYVTEETIAEGAV